MADEPIGASEQTGDSGEAKPEAAGGRVAGGRAAAGQAVAYHLCGVWPPLPLSMLTTPDAGVAPHLRVASLAASDALRADRRARAPCGYVSHRRLAHALFCCALQRLAHRRLPLTGLARVCDRAPVI